MVPTKTWCSWVTRATCPRRSPSGSSVISTVTTVTVPAREWIKEHKTGKPLATDWVFGGSKLVPNPEGIGKPDYYVANYGDVICVCNMDSALLDLPVESPKKFDIRAYEAATSAIPDAGTKVTVVFEVVPDAPKR